MTSPAILDALARASAAVADQVDRVADDQWAAPTPCTEWDVRALVGHLVGMDLVFVAMLEGGPRPDRGADHLGADPARAFRRSSAALLEAASRPGALDQTRTTTVGSADGHDRVRWRVADLLVHGWDLAVATGIDPVLDDDLVEDALAFAVDRLPGQPRAGRFAEPQPVGDDAPALDRLAAFTGRTLP